MMPSYLNCKESLTPHSMSRRRFVQTTLMASALPMIGWTRPTLAATPSDTALQCAFSAALFDSRYVDALSFAECMRRGGAKTYGYNGDITQLWFETLDPMWQQSPKVVAGLTTQATLFCLEQLAAQRHMRLVYSVDHFFVASNPATQGERMANSTRQYEGNFWGVQIAEAILKGGPNHKSANLTSKGPYGAPFVDPASWQQSLVGWIIAPILQK